jgi:hypothetical protein
MYLARLKVLPNLVFSTALCFASLPEMPEKAQKEVVCCVTLNLANDW